MCHSHSISIGAGFIWVNLGNPSRTKVHYATSGSEIATFELDPSQSAQDHFVCWPGRLKVSLEGSQPGGKRQKIQRVGQRAFKAIFLAETLRFLGPSTCVSQSSGGRGGLRRFSSVGFKAFFSMGNHPFTNPKLQFELKSQVGSLEV